MTRPSKLVATATVLVAVGAFGVAGDVRAQDDAGSDELMALIPSTFEGGEDVEAADGRYRAIRDALDAAGATPDLADDSELTGPCGGWVFSYDGDGELIDAALDTGHATPPVDLLGGGQAFTSENPFELDADGIVSYYGFAPADDEGPRNLRWNVSASGIDVVSGSSPNATLANRTTGVIDVADDVPLGISARVRVDSEMRSDNLAACVAEGHVVVRGNGLAGPIGIGSMLLIGGGLLGLFFHARPTLVATRS